MLQRQVPALGAENLLRVRSPLVKKHEIIMSYAYSSFSVRKFAAYGQRTPKEKGIIIIRTINAKMDDKNRIMIQEKCGGKKVTYAAVAANISCLFAFVNTPSAILNRSVKSMIKPILSPAWPETS